MRRAGLRRAGVGAEPLECRVLMASTPAGPEWQVNATTRGGQNDAAVAADAHGDFVVVWQGSYQDGTSGGIYARRFDRTGAPRGGDFRVNATTDTRGDAPAVAMDDAGDFVVTWLSSTPNGDNPRLVYARRYDAAGTAQGAPFAIAPRTNGAQRDPSVAVDADGDFVVGWQSYDLPSAVGIYARRFDRAGSARGDAFRVSAAEFQQTEASVAMDADGDFVVAWDSYVFGGAGGGDWDTLRARRYRADGAPAGEEFRVDVDPDPQPTAPAAAMDADGDFVIAWESYSVTSTEIRARRFTADGAGGEELRVSPPGGDEDIEPAVATGDGGDFVVAWRTGGDIQHVYARRYPAAAPADEAFRVDTASRGERDLPSVAADADGDFVVAWSAYYQEDSPGTEVMARRFDVSDDGPPAATVVGRHAFYNHSALDGGDVQATAADDAAIAADKVALLPGQAASFANVTSFDRGLNGVIVDVANLPQDRTLTTDDFDFGAALRPSSVTVRRGAGVNGSDRVTLIWTDYSPGIEVATRATANDWLRVTVKANANTGLSSPDVFSFGNLIGDTGDSPTNLRVTALDLGAVKRALNTGATPASTVDVNRDGRVNALDLGILKRNLNHSLTLLTPSPPELAAAEAPRGRRLPDDFPA